MNAAMSLSRGVASFVLGLAACGGPDTPPERPLSLLEHEQAAKAHEREQQSHEHAQREGAARRVEERYRCVDQPLAGVPYSGGQPIQVMRPCWTIERGGDEAREAEAHRKEAARHRTAAAKLAGAERDACADLGENELSHSPFFHYSDLLSAAPTKKKNDVVGAHVVFRKVEGLDAAWLERALRCHQARAAVMGYSATFQPYCPLSVGPVDLTVADGTDGIGVTIAARKGTDAAALWGRVEALMARNAGAR